MEVILLADVDSVGLRGDIVDVKRGFARNFLLPRRLAETATSGRVAELRRRDAQKARFEARTLDQAEQVADLLRRTVLRFEVKAGPGGALFGSVTATDVADELWRIRKVRVDRRKIGLDEPLKRIGRFEVAVEVFEGLSVGVKTLVVPEGGELPPEPEPEDASPTDAEAAPPAATEAASPSPPVEQMAASADAEAPEDGSAPAEPLDPADAALAETDTP